MSAAAAGMQYAELNANYESSLYQDVLTTPGASMNWQVAHTARMRSGDTWWRGKQDTMYVVIMAADQAAELAKSQEQLKQVAADLFNSSGSSSQYPGARAY